MTPQSFFEPFLVNLLLLVSVFCLLPSSSSRPSSTRDPLDPTAEPSSGLESPSNSLRQWTIGPVRATSHGSVTPRRDDRVEPVLVLRCVRWIRLLMTMGLVPTSCSYGEWAEPSLQVVMLSSHNIQGHVTTATAAAAPLCASSQ